MKTSSEEVVVRSTHTQAASGNLGGGERERERERERITTTASECTPKAEDKTSVILIIHIQTLGRTRQTDGQAKTQKEFKNESCRGDLHQPHTCNTYKSQTCTLTHGSAVHALCMYLSVLRGILHTHTNLETHAAAVASAASQCRLFSIAVRSATSSSYIHVILSADVGLMIPCRSNRAVEGSNKSIEEKSTDVFQLSPMLKDIATRNCDRFPTDCHKGVRAVSSTSESAGEDFARSASASGDMVGDT